MSAPPPPPGKGNQPPPHDAAGRSRGRAMPPGPPGIRPAGPGQPPRPGPPAPRPGMPPVRPMGPPQAIGRAAPPSAPPSAVGRAMPPSRPGSGPTPPGRGVPSISPADSQPGASRPGSGGPPPIGRAVYRGDPRSSTTPGTGLEMSVSELSLSTGTGAGSGGTTGTPQPSVGNGAANGSSLGRGATRGFRLPSRIKALEFTRPTSHEWQGKKGTFGTAFPCKTNYFRVTIGKDWNLQQYRVDFAPELDDIKKTKFLV